MIKNGANQKKLKKGIVSLRELQHDSHRSIEKKILSMFVSFRKFIRELVVMCSPSFYLINSQLAFSMP